MTAIGKRATSVQVDATFASELLALINDELSLDPDTVVEQDTDLVMTGQVDSLGVMEIVDWIESRLDVAVDPTEIVKENFETVDRMVGFARRLVDAN